MTSGPSFNITLSVFRNLICFEFSNSYGHFFEKLISILYQLFTVLGLQSRIILLLKVFRGLFINVKQCLTQIQLGMLKYHRVGKYLQILTYHEVSIREFRLIAGQKLNLNTLREIFENALK